MAMIKIARVVTSGYQGPTVHALVGPGSAMKIAGYDHAVGVVPQIYRCLTGPCDFTQDLYGESYMSLSTG